MARNITGRLKVTGKLETQGPLCVGGLGADVDVDLVLARDGQNRLYVPGTSLAGPLREWVRRCFGEDVVRSLFGFQEQKSDKGCASHVFVEDSVLNGELMTEVRDGVGIDRITGTAAKRAKFNRAVLPRGTVLPFAMTVELPDPEKEKDDKSPVIRNAIGHLLKALEAGDLGFGAARTRGLGRVRLTNLRVREEDWSKRRGTIDALRNGGGEITTDDLTKNGRNPKALPELLVEIHFEPDGPLMVKAEAEGIAVDMLPLVGATGGDNASLVLPGSGIKGAWRFQAERIVRTVLDRDPKNGFLEQVQLPLINHLFGMARPPSKQGGANSKAGRGMLYVEDCYCRNTFSRTQWRKVESAKDEPALRAALDDAGLNHTQQAFHVPVDRWTGGAANLYSNLEPMNLEWELIRMRLDLERLSEDRLVKPAIALLLLLIRDFSKERIPIGFGANRGLGSVRVHNVVLEGKNLPKGLERFNKSCVLGEGDLLALGAGVLGHLEEAWQGWIEQAKQEPVKEGAV